MPVGAPVLWTALTLSARSLATVFRSLCSEVDHAARLEQVVERAELAARARGGRARVVERLRPVGGGVGDHRGGGVAELTLIEPLPRSVTDTCPSFDSLSSSGRGGRAGRWGCRPRHRLLDRRVECGDLLDARGHVAVGSAGERVVLGACVAGSRGELVYRPWNDFARFWPGPQRLAVAPESSGSSRRRPTRSRTWRAGWRCRCRPARPARPRCCPSARLVSCWPSIMFWPRNCRSRNWSRTRL